MAMASMGRPEYKPRSIPAKWSSATTSGVKSVGAKDFVSKVWVTVILKVWV